MYKNKNLKRQDTGQSFMLGYSCWVRDSSLVKHSLRPREPHTWDMYLKPLQDPATGFLRVCLRKGFLTAPKTAGASKGTPQCS